MQDLKKNSPFGIYLEHCRKGELAYQVTEDGKPVFFPRVVAPGTASGNLEWRISKGLGTVHATTVVYARDRPPHNVALIDLDEGFRMMSRVEGLDPLRVKIGMRVKVRMHPGDEKQPPYPVFVPLTPDLSPPHSQPLSQGERGASSPPSPSGRGAGGEGSRGLKRGSVAVVGVAESDLGQVAPDVSPTDLMAQATQRALADCGLKLSEIDAVLCAHTQSRMSALQLCEYLRIKPRYFDTTQIGGSSFLSHLAHAQAAIEHGLAEVALIAYGSTQRSVSRVAASPREFNPYETPYRPFLPASAYALAASRHMHQFGTTREQLAEVAVAARKWALMNPVAWEKEPLTIEQVLNARMVSHPFTVRDCCLVTDGGGAMIVASADRARTLKKKPAYVLGTGEAIGHATISNMPDLTVTVAAESGPQAFRMSGLKTADVDMVSLYDAFTITPILFLEDLGFCPKGEGGRFVSNGAIAPGGKLAVNTSGGGLSYCHPGMYGLLVMIEAVRQVRGECGQRQVKDCEVALAHGNGGVLSSQCTVLFGGPATV